MPPKGLCSGIQGQQRSQPGGSSYTAIVGFGLQTNDKDGHSLGV